VVRARILVNGRRERIVEGIALRAPIDLRGLSSGRHTVTAVVVLRDGSSVRMSRGYGACRGR
jgi:hypothetical protein